MRTLVLDTNVVLDLFVFDDPAAWPLRAKLASGELRWIATTAMRDELERVLGYPQIAARLAQRGLEAAGVLAAFDRYAVLCSPAERAAATCADADDQKFVDLASQQGALLLSKDACVLSMSRQLARSGVSVARSL